MFLKIDLRSRYYQVGIKEEYIHKITLKTCYGHYQFMVVPFGLTNTLMKFMCLTNIILNKYLDKFSLIFLDDILVYSKSEEEHEEHLILFLKVLRDNQLYTKLSVNLNRGHSSI